MRSETLVTSIKASSGSLFNGDSTTQVIFDIPAMSGGYYLDTAATRLLFNVQLKSIGGTTKTSLTTGHFLFGKRSLIHHQ